MRIEIVPLILGGLLALIGLGLLFDAWTPDEVVVKRERRRRSRVERSRGGEAAIGVGVMCMGAAFLGRDTWAYSVVAVIAGAVFMLIGLIANWRYLGAVISNRGALRRRPESEQRAAESAAQDAAQNAAKNAPADVPADRTPRP